MHIILLHVASHFSFPPSAGCGQPSAPVNGSIEEYRSTEEGAEIQFHCDEGYTQDSMWSPDPQLLHCSSLPTCKHMHILYAHVFLNVCLFSVYNAIAQLQFPALTVELH